MMKRVYLFLLFIFSLTTVSSQLYIGPKFGVSLSTAVQTFNDDSYPSSQELSVEYVTSPYVAAVFFYKKGVISLQFEPAFTQLKEKLNMREDYYNNEFTITQYRNYWRNSFVINIGGDIKNRVRLYGQGGGTLSFLLDSGRRIGKYYFNFKNIKSYDTGLFIGIGAMLRIKKNWIDFSVRLDQSLTAYQTCSCGWLFGSYNYNQNLSYNISYVYLISKDKPKEKKPDKLFY